MSVFGRAKERLLLPILGILSFSSWIVLILCVYIAAALATVRFQTILNGGAPVHVMAIFEPIRYLIDSLTSHAQTKTTDTLELQGRAIEFLLVLIVLLISLAPALYIPYKLQKTASRQPLRTYPSDNEQARNKIMLDRYRRAQSVIVFAGNFNWLVGDVALGKRVIELAAEEKIRFVTNKKREEISKSLASNPSLQQAVLARLAFRQGEKVVCSVLRFHNNESFMYLDDDANEGRARICELRDIEAGRYLLKALGILLSDYGNIGS